MDAAIPWRTTAIVASAVAALELVGLLLFGAVVLGRPLAHRTREHAIASAAATVVRQATPKPVRRLPSAPAVPRVPRSKTGVLVLNGNGRQGAAGGEAQRLRTLGYRISGTRNAARMDYPATIVMFRPGYRLEARRLARDTGIGLRAVNPLDGLRPAQLGGSKLVVIVGA